MTCNANQRYVYYYASILLSHQPCFVATCPEDMLNKTNPTYIYQAVHTSGTKPKFTHLHTHTRHIR